LAKLPTTPILPELLQKEKNFMLILETPYPPSVNSYWGFHGNRRFLTKKAVDYKKSVLEAFNKSGHKGFGNQKLFVCIYLFPPDKRVRDIDNSVKSCLDALCQAGVFDDDSQIKKLLVQGFDLSKGGKAEIVIEPFSF